MVGGQDELVDILRNTILNTERDIPNHFLHSSWESKRDAWVQRVLTDRSEKRFDLNLFFCEII